MDVDAPMDEPATEYEPPMDEPAMDYYGLPINDYQPLPDTAGAVSLDATDEALPDAAASPAAAGVRQGRPASSGGSSEKEEHAGLPDSIGNVASMEAMATGPNRQSPLRSGTGGSSLPDQAEGGGNAMAEGAPAQAGGLPAGAAAGPGAGGGGGNASAAPTSPSTLIIRDWGSMGGGFIPFGSSPATLKLPAKGGRVRALPAVMLH